MELAEALGRVEGRRDAVLTTLRSDGSPQLTNIYFSLVDGLVRISVTDSRAKTKNLRRDPRCSLWVPGDDFFHWVVLEGEAELSAVARAVDDEATDELVAHYRAIYADHEDWDEFRRSQVADGRLIVRLRPTRAYGLWL